MCITENSLRKGKIEWFTTEYTCRQYWKTRGSRLTHIRLSTHWNSSYVCLNASPRVRCRDLGFTRVQTKTKKKVLLTLKYWRLCSWVVESATAGTVKVRLTKQHPSLLFLYCYFFHNVLFFFLLWQKNSPSVIIFCNKRGSSHVSRSTGEQM